MVRPVGWAEALRNPPKWWVAQSLRQAYNTHCNRPLWQSPDTHIPIAAASCDEVAEDGEGVDRVRVGQGRAQRQGGRGVPATDRPVRARGQRVTFVEGHRTHLGPV